MPLLVAISATAGLLIGAAAGAQEVGPLALPEIMASPAVQPPPMRLAEAPGVAPLALLRPAKEGALDQIEAMKAHNGGGHKPVQIGFSRPLPRPLRLRLTSSDTSPSSLQRLGGGYLAASSNGNLVWGTRVRVVSAYRLRLHLAQVSLPAGTRLWVWSEGQEAREFGLELLSPEGDLWTPSVRGEDIFLEVEMQRPPGPGERFGLELSEVGEIFRLGSDGAPANVQPVFDAIGECLLDATCFDNATFDSIDLVRKGIAHLEYVMDGDLLVCSGGLMTDVQKTGTPYLLTANHCLTDQGVASTLEAFWDYKTSACGGSFPNLDLLPRSQGATLLATSANTDFTLVRLNSIPGGRVLLGWSANPLPNGTVLHRVSHPAPEGFPFPQAYSRSTLVAGGDACSGLPRPQFLYSAATGGGTFGGSSGSPVFIQGGFVVGQLFGACGPNPDDGCDASNAEVDGAFSATFPAIAQFLDPAPVGPCVPSATTLCIDDAPGDRRFRVQVAFQSPQLSGNGNAIPLSSLGVSSGGLFWFFGPTNPELLVKVLNGCGLNDRYWVFWSAGTNVGLTLTVTDTVRGQSKSYTNPQGTAAAPVQDTNALPCG